MKEFKNLGIICQIIEIVCLSWVIFLIGFIISLIIFNSPTSKRSIDTDNLYSLLGTIEEFNYKFDTVKIKTDNGQHWEFEGIEDWFVGDRCIVIIDNNGTEKIKDDKIIKVIYTNN